MALVCLGILAGLALRYAGRDVTTSDTFSFLLPWYEHARANGWQSLGRPAANYNYTPFYGYLLLAASLFDGLARPWYLVKAISLFFEAGCAVMAWRIVLVATSDRRAALTALIAVWLAPTMLFNGSLWGQADAIWTFFALVCVDGFCRGRWRWGLLAFGCAVAVKAQAVFLGPLILALVLRGAIAWRWLPLIAVPYLVFALPAWLLGRPLQAILGTYLEQSRTFHRLSMNAANPWIFVPPDAYAVGVAGGLALALVAGLAFAFILGRSRAAPTPADIVQAAALAFLLMPFVLPKMHDRYFFAAEITLIVLACIRPHLAPLALAAQASGVAAYLVFHFDQPRLLAIAALSNGVVLACLILSTVDSWVLQRPDRYRLRTLAWLAACPWLILAAMQAL
ncbi:hypothetical protein ACFQ4G_00670 [Methylobacterium marchantiae]|uniref:DUF2029 domain-containing protein n=1 Tax=Methylobacterium marchantiae TaxID=600331 RepID=A0ABW3WV12_9HYPH